MIEAAPGARAVLVRPTNRRLWSSARRRAVAVAVSLTQPQSLSSRPKRLPRWSTRGVRGDGPVAPAWPPLEPARPGPWTRAEPCPISLEVAPSELGDLTSVISAIYQDLRAGRGTVQ